LLCTSDFLIISILFLLTKIANRLVNPTAIIPRFVDIRNSVEWNKKSPRNPMALIMVPIIIDFTVLSFDIMKPEVGPNTFGYNIYIII
jgi:hypothetical protein